MPTLNIYPDGDPEASSYDGSVSYYSSGVDFATVRSTTSGTAKSDNDAGSSMIVLSTSYTTGEYDSITRGYMLFDTNSLPSGATVSGVTLKFNAYASLNQLSVSDLVIAEVTTAANTAASLSDFNLANFGTEFGRTPMSSILPYGTTTITLNAAAVAAVQAGGVVKLGLSTSAEYDNVEPTWVSNKTTLLYGYAANANPALRPYIEVAYSDYIEPQASSSMDFDASAAPSVTYYGSIDASLSLGVDVRPTRNDALVVEKETVYKVYNGSEYIGDWKDVISELEYSQRINENGAALSVRLARSADQKTTSYDTLTVTGSYYISFAGASSSNVSISHDSSLDITDFGLFVDIKPNGVTGKEYLIAKGRAGSDATTRNISYVLYLQDGQVVLYSEEADGSDHLWSTGVYAVDGERCKLYGYYDSVNGDYHLYKDGALAASNTSIGTFTPESNTTSVSIGSGINWAGTPGDYYNGEVHRAAITDGVPTTDEINAFFDGEFSSSKVKFFTDFSDQSGPTVTDLSGNSNTGTVNGAGTTWGQDSDEALEDESGQSYTLVDQTPLSVGPGTDVDVGLKVEVLRYYGSIEVLTTETGEEYSYDDGEAWGIANGAPNGVVKFSGWIHTYSAEYGEGEFVNVQLLSHGTELANSVITSGADTTVSYNSQDPSAIITDVLDNYAGTVTYSNASIDTTGNSVSYTFRLNTVLEAIKTANKLAPDNWYWYLDIGQNNIEFHEKGTTADHVFVQGEHLSSLSLERSIQEIVNQVYFVGGDTGGGTYLYKKYDDASSQSTYRLGLERISDSRVTLAATASLIANRLIDAASGPVYTATVTVVAERYDIESIKLGQIVGFANFGNYIDDLTLQIMQIDYTPYSVKLHLEYLLDNMNKRVEDINRNQQEQSFEPIPNAPS